MKNKPIQGAIRVVAVGQATNPKAAHPRQHPCAQMTEEERRRGIVDVLSQALIQLKRNGGRTSSTQDADLSRPPEEKEIIGTATSDPWHTLASAARYIHVSKSLLSKAIKIGELRAAQVGIGTERRKHILRQSWIDAWLEAHASGGSANKGSRA
jgi:hypothetical protein